MRPTSTDEIRRFLADEAIYQRAVDYAQAGRVLRVEPAPDGTYVGLVKGSRGKEYRVVVREISRGLSLSCDCPYPNRCKHMGAVLLSLYGGLHEIDTPSSGELDAAASAGAVDGRSQKREQVLPLGELLGHSPVDSENDALRAVQAIRRHFGRPTTEKADDEETPAQYRLAFSISVPDPPDAASICYNLPPEGPNPVIRPVAQYIRQDGTGGRLLPYTSTRKVVPNPAAEQLVLRLRIGEERDGQPVFPYLSHLDEHPEIAVFLANSSTRGAPPPQLTFEAFPRLTLRFVFLAVDEPDIWFCLEVRGEDGEELRLFATESRVLALDCAQSRAAYVDDPILADLCRLLFSYHFRVTPPEARTLSDELVALNHPALNVIAFPKKLRIIDEDPRPVARLEPYVERTTVRALFAYRSQLVSTTDSSEWLEVSSTAPDECAVIRRQYGAEQRFATELERLFLRLSTKEDRFHSQPEEEYHQDYTEVYYRRFIDVQADVEEVLRIAGPALIDSGWEVRIHDEQVNVVRRRLRYAIVGSGEDWFEIQPGYAEDDRFVPVRLENGTVVAARANAREIVVVSREDLEKLTELSRLGGDAGRARLHRFDLGTLDEFLNEIHNPDDHEFARTRQMLTRLREFSGISEAPAPHGFRGDLRGYQREGLSWLLFLHEYELGGCLADDMGLGKTIQTLALLQTLKSRGELGRSLVVVPVTTMENWDREAALFTPQLSVCLHAGPERPRNGRLLPEVDLILVSYQTLRRDIELFSNLEFDYLILDESQYVKNARTATHKAIRAVRAPHRLALSGTPIENNTLELWSLMTILMPGLLGTKAEFVRRFGGPIERSGDEKAAKLLRAKIRPFVLRRRKHDVAADLPEREEILVYTEMASRQRRVYERYRETYRRRVKALMHGGDVMKAMLEIVQGLLKLRQIVLFPGLVDSSYSNYPSCKLDRFGEMIDTFLDEGNKVLVFSQFVKVLTRLRRQLERKGIPYAYLDGSTRRRQEEIDRFQSQQGVPVFLISLKAGGVGVNLTAAEYVLLFDPWWNPAVEAQAIDRTHRIGQQSKVIAYRLVVRDTVEEKILALQERKRKIAEAIVPTEASWIKTLSKEDVLELFS